MTRCCWRRGCKLAVPQEQSGRFPGVDVRYSTCTAVGRNVLVITYTTVRSEINRVISRLTLVLSYCTTTAKCKSCKNFISTTGAASNVVHCADVVVLHSGKTDFSS